MKESSLMPNRGISASITAVFRSRDAGRRFSRRVTARLFRLTALVLLALAGSALPGAAPRQNPPAASAERLTASVDPFIGTGGHGHTYPGPSLPFGMIQPGPDTRSTGWDSSSGYHYSDTRIIGFSHTHLSGTGIPDYNDVLLMPTTGQVGQDTLASGADGVPGYASSFSHAEEEASPGYYAVTLRDAAVRAELTTTLRVGLHRYAFPQGREAHVVLDLVHRDQVLDSVARHHGRPRADGPSPIEELGTGPTGVLRHPVLAPVHRVGDRFRKSPGCDRASGLGPVHQGGLRFRRCGSAAPREGRDLGGQRRGRAPEHRCGTARVGFRCSPAGGRHRVGARTRTHPRGGWHARSTGRLLHRAVPRDADAQCLHGCRRPVPRARPPGAQSRRLHLLLRVFALGHVSRTASVTHAHRPRRARRTS